MSTFGRLEVICGPMFAGKTEELLRRVRRALIAGRRVAVFSHALDTRHGDARLASHVGLEVAAIPVARPDDIEPAVADGTDVVAIDEAQFFGPDLVPVVGRLADRGMVVMVAGLDVTFEGRPFEPLPALMALAERVDKLTAICSICGEDAVFHVRLGTTGAGADALVTANVGGTESYQARCRRHCDASATGD
ncbi:MAG TPA: thymidine kinase [Candidatus Limnocylindrales bacterium]|nr:thymidine kinase [Candidatus Limnocylindrales bacterium]